MKRVRIFGITNRLGNDEYAYFADYDGESLAFVKKKLAQLLIQAKTRYGCIIRTKPRHYHIIIPFIFTPQEIAALHQTSESDLAHVYYWFKHGRNALRITRKRRNEKEFKLVHEHYYAEFALNRSIAQQLSEFIRLAYNASPPKQNTRAHKCEFVEYSLDDNKGRAYTNRFFNSKEFKDWLEELTENGSL